MRLALRSERGEVTIGAVLVLALVVLTTYVAVKKTSRDSIGPLLCYVNNAYMRADTDNSIDYWEATHEKGWLYDYSTGTCRAPNESLPDLPGKNFSATSHSRTRIY